MPDFNDSTRLGSGKEQVDRLTNLIAIFENPALISRRTGPKVTTFWVMLTNI
ncbi:hypothetical protein [Methanosarcina horonobensis]|uniref:hypothetical protein n=1 Tax=Methanosarcina horonobensis TaxID=418008 RepID=UPI000B0A7A84|nr:hypothetical protein [Methanosarcina horonobensis]